MDIGSCIQHDPSLRIGYCAQPFRTYWQPEPSIFSFTNRFASPGRPASSWLCIGEEQGQKASRDTWVHVQSLWVRCRGDGDGVGRERGGMAQHLGLTSTLQGQGPLLRSPSRATSTEEGLAPPGPGRPMN